MRCSTTRRSREIADTAYADLVESGKYSYRALASEVERFRRGRRRHARRPTGGVVAPPSCRQCQRGGWEGRAPWARPRARRATIGCRSPLCCNPPSPETFRALGAAPRHPTAGASAVASAPSWPTCCALPARGRASRRAECRSALRRRRERRSRRAGAPIRQPKAGNAQGGDRTCPRCRLRRRPRPHRVGSHRGRHLVPYSAPAGDGSRRTQRAWPIRLLRSRPGSRAARARDRRAAGHDPGSSRNPLAASLACFAPLRQSRLESAVPA